ncbi:urea ABC transporter permease subunit UrtB [Ferrovibrio sp.]|uniref:urea ABC transporter permease subunit UrtB n=1 Tax=Ferrovibrio sp. TaxID=1917215 RepID=UPI0025C24271|nr:urea ABC transporter permease subunit UrtB [Ferrovibrio sp.]
MQRFLPILLVVLMLALVAFVRPSAAQDLAATLSGLTDSDPKPAIAALTQSGDDKAKAALAALAAGNLYTRLSDGAVVIGETDGALIVVTNAATGEIEDMAKPEELQVIAVSDDVKSLLAGAVPAASSGPVDFTTALNGLKSDSFADKGKAIEALTDLGDVRAIAVFRALADGRLFLRKSDGLMVIGAPSGNDLALTSPLDGRALGAVSPGTLDPLFVNNNLRNVLREAVGRLGLSSADPAARQIAANALLDNATPEAVALLRDAYGRETVDGVKRIMALSLAAAEIAHPDKVKRLDAIAVLGAASDLRVRALLQARLNQEPDADVKAALVKAFDRMQTKITLYSYVENFVQGISLGSVLLLAAVGLAITFGVMGVINMAHGEMIMLGAYSAYVTQELFRALLPPGWIGAYLIVALPVAFLIAAAVGVVIERGVIRFLYGRPLETMLATWGVSLCLQQAVRSIFGATNKEVANPSWMTGAIDVAGGLSVTWNRVYIIIFCFLVLGLIALILKRTAFGLHMRAVTQNRQMAAVMGIPTARIDAMTFALGSGIAGMAGVALSQIGNVSPNLGTLYIVDSFLVVVFGGVGSLMGTLVGALTLGVVNKILEPVAGAVLGKVVVLVCIILFIQKRPRGLFAAKGRSADA